MVLKFKCRCMDLMQIALNHRTPFDGFPEILLPKAVVAHKKVNGIVCLTPPKQPCSRQTTDEESVGRSETCEIKHKPFQTLALICRSKAALFYNGSFQLLKTVDVGCNKLPPKLQTQRLLAFSDN